MATDSKTSQAIFHGSTSTGLRNVGSYQASGHPFVTGSENLDATKMHMIEFDYVSKSITVINKNASAGEDIRIHFQSGSGTPAFTFPGESGAQTRGGGTIGANTDVYTGFHYITVPAGDGSVTLDVKCRRFFVSNPSSDDDYKYQVFAELTDIPARRMFNLTGSGVTD